MEGSGKIFSTFVKLYYTVNEIGNIFPLTSLLVLTIVNRHRGMNWAPPAVGEALGLGGVARNVNPVNTLINLTTSSWNNSTFHYKDLSPYRLDARSCDGNSIDDPGAPIELCNLRWICVEVMRV